jgi:hypothetical protein
MSYGKEKKTQFMITKNSSIETEKSMNITESINKE